jgi:hypothetical protein
MALEVASTVVAATRGLLQHLINNYPHLKIYHRIIPHNVLRLNWIPHFIAQKTIRKITRNYTQTKSFIVFLARREIAHGKGWMKGPTAIYDLVVPKPHPLEEANAIAVSVKKTSSQLTSFLTKVMNGGWRLEFSLHSKLISTHETDASDTFPGELLYI